MRWWLAAAFAAVAAITAVAVVAVLNGRSEHAFRRYAEDFAVGSAVSTAEMLKHDETLTGLRRHTTAISARAGIALYVFDARGRLLTGAASHGTTWASVRSGEQALAASLAGNRFIGGTKDGSAIVVGLRIHGGAGSELVAYSSRPELRTQLGIVRNEFSQSALTAFVLGAAVGLLVATLTGRRLARIARAAHAIGSGDFTVRVTDGFPDEVGSLAGSIEEMRSQLAAAFALLRDDRNRLERLLDRLDEGVVLLRRDLTVEFANGRARELAGDDLVKSPVGRKLQRFAVEVFASELPAQLHLETDDERTLLVSAIPPGAGTDTVMVVLADESQRERAERVQREFATNAAHELRTPLASIVTAVEMLQTGAKNDEVARDEFLDVIEVQAARLTRLTRALLLLARSEAQQQEPRLANLELAEVLEQVAGTGPPSASIVVECPRDLVAAAERDLLVQALSNLVANAVQASDGAQVVLRGAAAGEGRVRVDVIDRGTGIPEADQARIFDRFYRAGDAATGGFGLGLSIARSAVHALGGSIELTSQPGEGTMVRVTLAAGRLADIA